MNGEKITFQVKFWAFIGPFICLLTLFVFFVKGTVSPFSLPLALLFGVPLCWKWKLKGFAGSVVAVAVILIYQYSSIPLDERFWHLGMGISILMSLLITALSFEEVESMVETMIVESRSRLENLWKVDEKLQQTTVELKKKKEKIRELGVKERSYQKLLDKYTEDLVELRELHQKNADELSQAKKELDELRLQPSSAQPQASTQLSDELAHKQKFLEEVKEELVRTQEQLSVSLKENEEMKSLQEVEQALERQLVKLEQEKEEREVVHQKEIEALQQMLADALKSKGE